MTAATIDEFLSDLPDDRRAALERLRQQIRAGAPDAVETIAYGMPAFKLRGRYFVGFGTSKQYCSFYTGRAPVEALAADLTGYRLWKGTINFEVDHPLPPDLVTRLLEVRLAQFAAD